MVSENISIENIIDAARRINAYINHTPILSSSALNNITGADLLMKCENFQKVGAFKFRGACNAVFSLSDIAAKNGVVTHSSGNHAQALALAAKLRKIPAYIVMPSDAVEVKKQAVLDYGAYVTYCAPDLSAREITADALIKKTNAQFVHPYDDPDIIAGQGTVALEFLKEQTDLDYLIAPVGGGGLLSGTLLATKAIAPRTKVIAAEPLLANDAYLSFKEKKLIPSSHPKTICDGLLTSLSERTFRIMLQHVDDVLLATEENILLATKYIWQRMKIIIEPSAAVTLAVVLQHPSIFTDKKVGLILSGGNVDFKILLKNFSTDT